MGLSANNPTLVGPFDISLLAEASNTQGNIISEPFLGGQNVVEINNLNDFVEFQSIIRGVDVLKINYKSLLGKSIKVEIDGDDKGDYQLPSSLNYSIYEIDLCVEAGSDVKILSNDSNVAYINYLQLEGFMI